MPLMRMLAALLFLAAPAMAQAPLQGGPWTPGHIPQYVGNGSQPVVMDGGGAGGAPVVGENVSEIGITSRSPTNTYPSANSGNGPFGAHNCMYDAPITNATGYHYLCLDPNAQGGGLLTYGAANGATPLPLYTYVNGQQVMIGSIPAATTSALGGVLAQSSYNGATGLGSAANASLGTAGATLCLLSSSCAWSGTQTFAASLAIQNILGTSSYWTSPSRAGLGWEEALGTAGSPVTNFGPNVKISRTESYASTAGCNGNNNNADCNGALAVYSTGLASSVMQGTALQAAAIGYQQTGPYNDTVGATFYGATYPSGNTATPVFAASGSTITGLPSATYPVGSSVVFTVTGGSLPTGITAGVPYQIMTTSGGVATITLLNPNVSSSVTPWTPTQVTWTGSGTGTQLATQGTSDNKATALFTSAKTYSPDGKAISQEVNIVNLSGADAPRDTTDGNGFFGLLVSCGGGTFTPQWNCGNAVQVTNSGKTWNSGFVVTGAGVYYADFDAEGSSQWGLLIGPNHSSGQISGNHFSFNVAGDLSVLTGDSSQAYFGSYGMQNAIVTIDNTTTGNQAAVFLNDAGVNKWQLVKTSSNAFALWDTTASRNVFSVASGGAFTLAASTASAASLNIPQGTAPTSPNNGDIWMTSAGLYYRFNGTTHGPL